MVKHLKDSQLSVFVTLVLEDLLDSDGLTSFSDCGLEYDTERTITNDLFSVVSHALLLPFSFVFGLHLNYNYY